MMCVWARTCSPRDRLICQEQECETCLFGVVRRRQAEAQRQNKKSCSCLFSFSFATRLFKFLGADVVVLWCVAADLGSEAENERMSSGVFFFFKPVCMPFVAGLPTPMQMGVGVC